VSSIYFLKSTTKEQDLEIKLGGEWILMGNPISTLVWLSILQYNLQDLAIYYENYIHFFLGKVHADFMLYTFLLHKSLEGKCGGLNPVPLPTFPVLRTWYIGRIGLKKQSVHIHFQLFLGHTGSIDRMG
ncbi:hypothetical protein ACJX0J_013302, partial [Zea mays]